MKNISINKVGQLKLTMHKFNYLKKIKDIIHMYYLMLKYWNQRMLIEIQD